MREWRVFGGEGTKVRAALEGGVEKLELMA